MIWGLAAICQLHRIPFDGNLVPRTFPLPYTLETLLHAAASLGFRAGVRASSAADLSDATLPALALLEPPADAPTDASAASQPEASASDAPPARLALIVRAEGGTVVFVDPSSANPQSLGVEEF